MALICKSLYKLSLTNALLPCKTSSVSRISTCGALRKISIEEKLGITPKPKRPRSTFLMFTSQIKPSILKQNPQAPITEVNRIASERWKTLDDKTKASFVEEYKRQWDEYKKKLVEYDRTLTPEQKEQVENALHALDQAKHRRKLKMKKEEMGRPKKPMSTFVRFMKSKAIERGDTPFREWQQKVKKDWENASSSVKEQLNQIYLDEMKKYQDQLRTWENKMKKEGHRDLIDKSDASLEAVGLDKDSSQISSVSHRKTSTLATNKNHSVVNADKSVIYINKPIITKTKPVKIRRADSDINSDKKENVSLFSNKLVKDKAVSAQSVVSKTNFVSVDQPVKDQDNSIISGNSTASNVDQSVTASSNDIKDQDQIVSSKKETVNNPELTKSNSISKYKLAKIVFLSIASFCSLVILSNISSSGL